MKLLTYILLFLTLSLNAQNWVLGCAETIKTDQFLKVNDTLKGYSSMVMMQSKSGLKIAYAEGNTTFIHGLLAREELGDKKPPYLYIGNCINIIYVSSRINLEVGNKYCWQRIKIIDQ